MDDQKYVLYCRILSNDPNAFVGLDWGYNKKYNHKKIVKLHYLLREEILYYRDQKSAKEAVFIGDPDAEKTFDQLQEGVDYEYVDRIQVTWLKVVRYVKYYKLFELTYGLEGQKLRNYLNSTMMKLGTLVGTKFWLH